MNRSITFSSAIAAFFRDLPDKLQQPSGLAFMGSAVAHLLFFATLPAFTSSTPDLSEAELRQVRVIELPSEQQAALPQIQRIPAQRTPVATSSIGLPAVPKAGAKVQIPAGASLLPQAIAPTKVPGATQVLPPSRNPLYNIPNLDIPAPPPPPTPADNVKRAQDLQRALERWSQPSVVRLPKAPKIAAPSATPPTAPSTTPTAPPLVSATSDSGGSQPSSAAPVAPTAPSPGEGIRAADPAEIAKSPGVSSSQPQTNPPEVPANTPVPPAQLPNQSGPQTVNPNLPTNNQPIAANPSNNSTTASARESLIARNLDRQNEFLIGTRYDPAGTETRRVESDWAVWMSKVDPRIARVEHPSRIEETPALDYPLSFPIRKYKQHTALVVAQVGADGKLIGEPQLFGRTGYPLLNKAAIEHVKSQLSKLPASGKVTVHTFRLKFKPPGEQRTAELPQSIQRN